MNKVAMIVGHIKSVALRKCDQYCIYLLRFSFKLPGLEYQNESDLKYDLLYNILIKY